MASNILASTTTTTTTLIILIICALSSTTIAEMVLDTDGEPLLNGAKYYILPQYIGVGGGLSLKPKDEDTPCPLYISRDKDETSPGVPVTISSPLRIGVILTSIPINLAFEGHTDVCMQPMGWQVVPDETTGHTYVATGGRGLVLFPGETFQIEEGGANKNGNEYKIKLTEGEKDVGFFDKDGLLGITSAIPLSVVFKRAYDDVLAMKPGIDMSF